MRYNKQSGSSVRYPDSIITKEFQAKTTKTKSKAIKVELSYKEKILNTCNSAEDFLFIAKKRAKKLVL